MNLKRIAVRYLEVFAEKDLEGLAEFFADDASLRDWDVWADGKQAVMEANGKIFEATGDLELTPLEVYADGSTVVVEFRLVVGGTTELLVTDIIGFDAQGKIRFVRAYKGN